MQVKISLGLAFEKKTGEWQQKDVAVWPLLQCASIIVVLLVFITVPENKVPETIARAYSEL